MDRELAFSRMVMSTRVNYDTAFFTERALSSGQMEPFIKASSSKTK